MATRAEDLVARARQEHIARGVETRVIPFRLVGRVGRSGQLLQSEVHCLVGWLQRRFGGVSRRYMPNYLAQYAYVANRWHRREQLFDLAVRRLMQEPWRPKSDLALLTP